MRLTRPGRIAWALALAGGTALFASGAHAADIGEAPLDIAAPGEADTANVDPAGPPADAPSSWEVEITPYFWLAGMKGDLDIPVGSGNVDFDNSFSDVLGKLKFVFMGAVDVRHGRFVAMADTIYLNLGVEAKGIHDPQFVTGRLDSKLFFSTLSGGYRIVDKGPFFVDLVAGLRYITIDNDLRLQGPVKTREGKASGSDLAPLVGARMRVPLGKDWGLVLYGDTGGFASSDIKWQLIGTVQWDISRHWRAIAGYRHMDIHHRRDDQDFNIALTGPLLGFSYRF
ncbi:MAG: hypothetical protein E6G94_08595 [Alphaproteobacteria bacterium]|nr:MAG: hypothetical protein E6G94_08595 [Alphaproteobacteria bacterium]